MDPWSPSLQDLVRELSRLALLGRWTTAVPSVRVLARGASLDQCLGRRIRHLSRADWYVCLHIQTKMALRRLALAFLRCQGRHGVGRMAMPLLGTWRESCCICVNSAWLFRTLGRHAPLLELDCSHARLLQFQRLVLAVRIRRRIAFHAVSPLPTSSRLFCFPELETMQL